MPTHAAEPPSTAADGPTVTFALADPERRWRGVRLTCGLSLSAEQRRLRRTGTTWTLTLPRPAVDRLEYEFEVDHPDGSTEHVCDPANPERTRGEFGDRSVLLLGAYRAPTWLDETPVPGRTVDVVVHSRSLGALTVPVWAPADADATTRLPLLVAHDGPSYERISRLTQFSGAGIARGRLPPHRVALLSAGDRSEWYAASARYARALTADVLPALAAAVGVAGPPVGVGASLGGLALLHAEDRFPGAFGGLFLQSSSFFLPRFDAHESGFRRYGRIVRFVEAVSDRPTAPEAPPVVLTCGCEEENLHNNRAMARALTRRGVSVELHEVRGLHDHVAWRDALDPHLTALLARVWPPS